MLGPYTEVSQKAPSSSETNSIEFVKNPNTKSENYIYLSPILLIPLPMSHKLVEWPTPYS